MITNISKTHVQNLERKRYLPSLDQETKYNELQYELNQLNSVLKQKKTKQLVNPLLPSFNTSPVIKGGFDMSLISSIVYNKRNSKNFSYMDVL